MSVRQGRIGILAAVLAASLSATPAFAEGDATVGKAIFKKNCRVCHQAEKEKNGAGPYLVGIIGRPAASVENFKRYSKPMKASGIVWDGEQNLRLCYGTKEVPQRNGHGFSWF